MGMKDPQIAVAQMRENCKRDLPWFVGIGEHGHEFVPICGGPSLRTRLQKVKARQRKGGNVVACNGAARLLKAEGIEPDIIAFVDPSPVVKGFIPESDDGNTIYLAASICHPDVLTALEGRRVILWHPDICEPEQAEILDLYPGKPSVLIGGGNTIGLRMLSIGYLMGFRSFHFYGLDSSYADDGADHAYVKHDGPETGKVVTAMFNGKTYRGSSWMIQQSGEFLDDYYPMFAAKGCDIHVHGEGLVPDICKALRRSQRKAA